MNDVHVATNEVVDAAEALLDVSVSSHYDEQSGDTFEQCHACGGWEEHKEDCFVPNLKTWLYQPGATVRVLPDKKTLDVWEWAPVVLTIILLFIILWRWA